MPCAPSPCPPCRWGCRPRRAARPLRGVAACVHSRRVVWGVRGSGRAPAEIARHGFEGRHSGGVVALRDAVRELVAQGLDATERGVVCGASLVRQRGAVAVEPDPAALDEVAQDAVDAVPTTALASERVPATTAFTEG